MVVYVTKRAHALLKGHYFSVDVKPSITLVFELRHEPWNASGV